MAYPVTYTALVLTPESQDKLAAAFREQIPEDWKVYAHHMTINMGNIKPDMADLLGTFADLVVKSFAINDMVAAVSVDSEISSTNKIPHITVAVNVREGGKPFHSNKLVDWNPVEPIVLRGRLEEV